MPQTAIITLTSAGTYTGPFDLYSDADGYVTPFETGVSKAALLAGYTSTNIPDLASTVRVQSGNIICDNYIDLFFGTTTTTSTSIVYSCNFTGSASEFFATEVTVNNITIPQNGSASPYPVVFNIGGVTAPINSIEFQLTGYSHTYPGDVGMYLISPNNNYYIMINNMSGGGTDAVNANVTFSGSAVSVWNGRSSGIYLNPTAGVNMNFNPPSPISFSSATTYDSITVFNGLGPSEVNGSWKFWAQDFFSGDSGSIASVTLTIVL